MNYKSMWLGGGQFYCDSHRNVAATIPYFYAPPDATCAVCSTDAPQSYLRRKVNPPNVTADFTEDDITNLRHKLLSVEDGLPVTLLPREALYLVACMPAKCAVGHMHESAADAFICNSGGDV